jgi:hypothetical protein
VQWQMPLPHMVLEPQARICLVLFSRSNRIFETLISTLPGGVLEPQVGVCCWKHREYCIHRMGPRAMLISTEMGKIQLVLFGMHNRTFQVLFKSRWVHCAAPNSAECSSQEFRPWQGGCACHEGLGCLAKQHQLYQL